MNLIRTTLKALEPKPLGYLSSQLQGLLTKHLWAQVLLGFFLGIVAGLALSYNVGGLSSQLVSSLADWVSFPGYLFLRLIQMIVIPLVFASIILGIASSENIDQLKRMGLSITIYFLSTTTVALIIGLAIATIVQPGSFIDPTDIANLGQLSQIDPSVVSQNQLSIQDRVLSVLPQNPLAAMSDSNMLQVVTFALIMGVALISIAAKQAQPIVDLLGSVQEVCMTVVKWSMILAPIAVFGLTTKMMATVGFGALAGLGAYMATVILGLLAIQIFYLLMITFIGKRSPLSFLKSIVDLQLLAFSTSSSAAVMPLSIETAVNKLKVKPSVAHFIIPLGSTVNMDGTAVYQIIATIFLAQAFGIDLTTGQMFLVGLTAVGASVGSPGTPGVGIVILATILESVGIPLAGTALILSVDRILDMLRTVINVTGDLTATVIMDKLIRNE